VLENVSLTGGRKAAFAGFAQLPFDTRSACFAAMDVTMSPEEDARACRSIGAPLTFLCHQGNLLWWSQTERGPYQIGEPIPPAKLEGFFREHAEDFEPRTIYRAKTLGRFQESYQRSFVDLGLMPLLEKEAGQTIERLLLDSVAEARDALHWPKEVDLKQGQWLVKSVFWLLGAKMLHDKEVEGFIRLNFGNVDEVFSRVATHYGESAEGLVASQPKRLALEKVGKRIAASADLRLATTEALAYVYENTLISDEVRAEFGTHSTPSYLVDYIVGRLEPWIRAIPQDKRSVFEPATGHGAFLIAAIRLLTSLLSANVAAPAARKKYLRDRIRGYDVDDFAIEIARLSLTLTDIPNPNGWSVKPADLFESDLIEKAGMESTILLANPPFEDFKAPQRAECARKFREPQFLNKTAEMLHRAFSSMPSAGVFGVVIPQSLLHESNAVDFRRLLVEQFEFQELCLFPDKVFNFADQESAVLVGRKHPPASASSAKVRYRRVRERQMEHFRKSYDVTSEIEVSQDRFQHAENFDLRVPDLESVWNHCAYLEQLSDYVDVGQGFSFVGKDRPNFPKDTITASDKFFKGAVKGFENLGHGIQTHQLPPLRWLNLSPEVIRCAISGTTRNIPQVLLNEAPVQRAPWCLRAMIDRVGLPAKSCFTILRPLQSTISLEAIWALMNCPFANAYAYAHSSKWHILTGTLRKMPVPKLSTLNLQRIEVAVHNYLEAVARYESPLPLRSDDARAEESKILCDLHWRMDAEVLRCYDLPVYLERQLLDYFAGWERSSVPFRQDQYFPEGFDEPISLADYLAITTDWDATNRRRLKLIEKKQSKTISDECREELRRLQKLAGLKRELHSSPSLKQLADMEADLRRRGSWRGA
jgi:type I restriction-modification system DNA methylase subunit